MSTNLLTRIKAVREAGMVERAHLAWHGGSYNIAQHSYNVAALCWLLWPDRPQLLPAALFHDTPERWTGDVPSTPQNDDAIREHLEVIERQIYHRLNLTSYHALSPTDKMLLKCADRLELWLWTWEEERRGNREVLGFRSQLDKTFSRTPLPEKVEGVVSGIRGGGWDRLSEDFADVIIS